MDKKEYIEKEAVIRLIKTEGFNEKYDLGDPKDNVWFCEEVNRIPAADVVEVVRCENCVPIICPLNGRHKSDDDYCSFGIPRE